MTEECINLHFMVSHLFSGKLVQIDTPIGSVGGVLKRADRCLLLEDPDGWLLIKHWISIKRRLPEDLRPRFCCDCEESTVHQTGSQLWVSCRLQDGWRPISSECVLVEKKGRQ